MTTSIITAIDLLSPPPPDISYVADTTQKHRLAAERERLAWKRLTQSRLSHCADERTSAFAEWVTANNELREAQSLCTSAAISKAMEEMRDCAALLARNAPPDAGPRAGSSAGIAYGQPQCFGSRPQVGQVFRGRGGVLWTVANVTEDMLEPELFLVQMECTGGAAAEGVHDVYCEDWALFCIVHGLAGVHAHSH